MMNMLHSEKNINNSIDSDDFELPSLSERVQVFKSSHTLQLASDNKAEENDFQKVSKKNCSTPCPKINLQLIFTSDSEAEESDFQKVSKKSHSTPSPQIKHKTIIFSSDSEDDDSEFSNFLKKNRSTQCSTIKKSPPERKLKGGKMFSNHSLNGSFTPKFEKSKKYDGSSGSDSDEEFENIIKSIHKSQTPEVQNKQIHWEGSDCESDGAFSDVIEKLGEMHIPKSQKKNGRNFVFSTDSGKHVSSTPSLKGAEFQKTCSLKTKNEMEYATLFPLRPVNLSSKDQAMYGQKLFEFFNEKIFSSKLPANMCLVWSNSLLRAAGLTYCTRKNGIRSCSIKLSSKLLTSFDRLQDTLLHEMCHAAVWLISESNEKHGPLWQTWASRCKLILPSVECPERCHNYDIPYRVWYQCLNCNWKKGKCKQSKKYQTGVCKKCKAPIVMTTN